MTYPSGLSRARAFSSLSASASSIHASIRSRVTRSLSDGRVQRLHVAPHPQCQTRERVFIELARIVVMLPRCIVFTPQVRAQDVKNAFQTALEAADIKDFTWHDLRHTFASWLIMKGASLRSVAELLGHRGLRMAMRYAHLSPAYLSAEVGLLDAPPPPPAPPSPERATKGQRALKAVPRTAKVVEFPKENGSSGWIRTSNPPVNSCVGTSCD